MARTKKAPPVGTPSILNDPQFRKDRASLGGQARNDRIDSERDAVLRELGPMRTVEDALRRLEVISDLSMRSLLPGAQAHAAAAAVRTFVDTLRVASGITRLRELQQQVERLERERASGWKSAP